MWLFVLLTPVTFVLFVFLFLWTQRNRSANPFKYNIVVYLTFLLSYSVLFVGILLRMFLDGTVPACLVSDVSCIAAEEASSGVGSTLVCVLGFVGLFGPLFLLGQAVKRKCPRCRRLWVLNKVDRVFLRTEINEEHYSSGTGKYQTFGKRLVATKIYQDNYVCSVCGAKVH